MLYAIITYGDAQGGSRDDIRVVSEEEARSYQDPSSWSRAVRIEIKDLD